MSRSISVPWLPSPGTPSLPITFSSFVPSLQVCSWEHFNSIFLWKHLNVLRVLCHSSWSVPEPCIYSGAYFFHLHTRNLYTTRKVKIHKNDYFYCEFILSFLSISTRFSIHTILLYFSFFVPFFSGAVSNSLTLLSHYLPLPSINSVDYFLSTFR